MRKYFYDWEFHEDGETIVPISLGMVSDDDRELYLINEDYIHDVLCGTVTPTQWLIDNVLSHISFADIMKYGISEIEFADAIQKFVSKDGEITSRDDVEMWAYFASYDHVCLAQRFGAMIDLPEPIPMRPHELLDLIDGRTVDFEPDVEHNPLSDARWNRRVWEYFTTPDLVSVKDDFVKRGLVSLEDE